MFDKTECIFISDFEEDRIYYTFASARLPIRSSSLNGSNVQDTDMSLDSGYGIDVSSTHIYYADFFRGLGKFEKSNSTYDVLLYANNPVIAVKIFKPEGSSILVNHSLQSTVN